MRIADSTGTPWRRALLSSGARRRLEWVALSAALGLFIVAVIRTAWVCDDAYIAFRTIDNFVNGYGLRWNVAERVQSFTAPLWLFLVSGAYVATREFYFTSIVLGIVLSMAAVGQFAFCIAPTRAAAVTGVSVLLLSKAFTDFSTAGLENPLTHLLLVLFFCFFFSSSSADDPPGRDDHRRVLRLGLCAGLIAVNRLDTMLLVTPALARAVVKTRRAGTPWIALAGFAPLLAWEAFSLVYYGVPFPNTAYAKLGGEISRQALVLQGLAYLLDAWSRDPITPLTLAVALATLPFVKAAGGREIAAGGLLSVVYVIAIGGDFMSGRFLAAPLLMAVIGLSRSGVIGRHPVPVLGVVVLVALFVPMPPVLSGADYGTRPGSVVQPVARGVTDERAFYYPTTGLLAPAEGKPAHPWVSVGRDLRAAAAAGGPQTIAFATIGFAGFYAGPRVHIVDPLGLGDAFLARLPADPGWMIGHLHRELPAGYLETVRSGHDRLVDPGLRRYYSKLRLLISGPLWNPARLAAIAGINTGRFDHWLADYGRARVPLDAVSRGRPATTPADAAGVLRLPARGVLVRIGQETPSGAVEMSLGGDGDYRVDFMWNEEVAGTLDVSRWRGLGAARHRHPELEMQTHRLRPPARVIGFDAIRIAALAGHGPFSLGHVRLLTVAAPFPEGGPRAAAVRGDVDGDGKADLAVYRPKTGACRYLLSSSGFLREEETPCGGTADLRAPGDYDGDGRTEVAILTPPTIWWRVTSRISYPTFETWQFGTAGDLPVPADWNGDGATDLAVFRPVSGQWFVRLLSGHTWLTHAWGATGDVPIPGDYDGDGTSDLAVFRPSNGTWHVRTSSSGYRESVSWQWGETGDVLLPGDWDGDGSDDAAAYRPAASAWFIRVGPVSSGVSQPFVWGTTGDVPVPADYDGDGRMDAAVYRPASGEWLIRGGASHRWGDANDVPIRWR